MGPGLNDSVGQVDILLALIPRLCAVQVPQHHDVSVRVLGTPVVHKELREEVKPSSVGPPLQKEKKNG